MKDLYKNVHSHIFTMDNAPENFLNLYMPKPISNALDTATNTQAGAWMIQKLIQSFGDQGKRYAGFLRIGKSKSQLNVFEELLDRYTDKSMEMIALTLNMDYIGAGKTKSGFEGQIQQVIDIKRQYPDRMQIFLGIDPRWKNTGSELRKTVESYFETRIESGGRSIYPFAGLKIYPSTGFYAFDYRLKETFEWAAANGVPVMSHCYYLGGIFNYSKAVIEQNLVSFDPYANAFYAGPKFITEKNFKKWIVGGQETANCKNSCSYFLEPYSYRTMLDKLPNLKVCFAHFGGVDQIRASIIPAKNPQQSIPYGVAKKNWFTQIQEIIAHYPGAYTDISYDVAEGAVEKDNFLYNMFYLEANKPYGNKVLYGTDFFMTEIETEEQNTYNRFKTFASAVPLTGHGNVSMWDQIAKINTNQYLNSKYY
ncbi:amidohydrolase family protein [Flavobacterium sp.]|uniref:amidohydrolase family protein n=1 Tax=Flavobacterium sp. TaxID=239 RepID=UPI0039E36776